VNSWVFLNNFTIASGIEKPMVTGKDRVCSGLAINYLLLAGSFFNSDILNCQCTGAPPANPLRQTKRPEKFGFCLAARITLGGGVIPEA
jgi:hypothetical protein